MDLTFSPNASKYTRTTGKNCVTVNGDADSNETRLSSTGYLSLWAQMPNNCPWLVLYKRHGKPMAYSFLRRTWENFASSFLNEVNADKGIWRYYYGSGTGPRLLRKGGLRIYNPLMKRCSNLPPMEFLPKAMPKAMVAGVVDGSNREIYKVVSVGHDKHTNTNNIEIYDSVDNSWRIVLELPINVSISRHHGIVLCKDVLVCVITLPRAYSMVYNLKEGKSSMTLVPLPRAENKCKFHMVTCGSSVLLVGATVVNSQAGNWYMKDGIIWQLQKEEVSSCNWDWKEIARMPPSLCQDPRWRNAVYYECECIGVENYLCLRRKASREVCTYNLSEGSWNWIEKCPVDRRVSKMIALEPSSDMVV
ncbi:hypothetical protein SUGI_1108000 [Cryptomeria japonica]|uniref:uncharacterized protein LOC131032021 n=1 Tax=Cryptomeria japonica TaxID=3369 RepID=UPI002414803E|nr:uncharacterized protein LOC131032021 [Cryptomeria japonica]GLJ52097.1 hypothetical protein SUGI_1108000 [Cryptomeria japonica]